MWTLCAIILPLLRDSLSVVSLVWTTREIEDVIYLDLTLSWQHWLRPQHSSHYIASYGGACSENVFLEHSQCRSRERYQTLKLVWYFADLKARNNKFSIFQFILLLVINKYDFLFMFEQLIWKKLLVNNFIFFKRKIFFRNSINQ